MVRKIVGPKSQLGHVRCMRTHLVLSAILRRRVLAYLAGALVGAVMGAVNVGVFVSIEAVTGSRLLAQVGMGVVCYVAGVGATIGLLRHQAAKRRGRPDTA